MGELAERLSLLGIEARSPDGGLTATVRGRGEVRVSFARDSYSRYAAAGLARQLEQLAALAWARYRRRYLQIVAAYVNAGDETAESEEDRIFRQRLEQLTVSGVSGRQWVRVRSRALVSWEVRIAGEPVGSLTEQEFLAELDSAVAGLLADHRAKLILLTDAVHDIGLPRAMRTAGRENL